MKPQTIREDDHVREQAIEILSLCACNFWMTTFQAERTLLDNIETPAGDLARSALEATKASPRDDYSICCAYAEAEAMLRCGWLP